MEHKLQRCEPDDPNRCQVMCKHGQCPFKAVEGGSVCQRHGANRVELSRQNSELKNYYLTKYRDKVARLSSQPELKSLRDEIGILRMMVESKLNNIEDDTDLMLQSAQISDLVERIRKLVESCDKIDFRMGQLLDKKYVDALVSGLVTVISEEMAEVDQAISERIITRILDAVGGED